MHIKPNQFRAAQWSSIEFAQLGLIDVAQQPSDVGSDAWQHLLLHPTRFVHFRLGTILGGWASVDKNGSPLSRPSDAALLSCWAVACDICACPARRMPVLFCIVRKARSELCADSRCSAVSWDSASRSMGLRKCREISRQKESNWVLWRHFRVDLTYFVNSDPKTRQDFKGKK